MGQGEDETEFGEFRGLELEEAEVNPAHGAPAVGGADAGDQHGRQRQNGGPIDDHGPPGQDAVIGQA